MPIVMALSVIVWTASSLTDLSVVRLFLYLYEPHHDKTNVMRLRPAWIQPSLRVRAVLSGSMLFAISVSTCYRVGKQTAWLVAWSTNLRIRIANPLCWFCHGTAHMCVSLCLFFEPYSSNEHTMH
jgi:hypothetical protein